MTFINKEETFLHPCKVKIKTKVHTTAKLTNTISFIPQGVITQKNIEETSKRFGIVGDCVEHSLYPCDSIILLLVLPRAF